MNNLKPDTIKTEKPSQQNLIIIMLSLLFTALVLLIAIIVVVSTRNSGEEVIKSDDSSERTELLISAGKIAFEDLTKEEAQDIIKQNLAGENNILSKILPSYDDFKNEDYQSVKLVYSYNNLDDFITGRNEFCVVNNFSNGRQEYTGQEIVDVLDQEYYALAKAKTSQDCDVLYGDVIWVAFREKYLDFSLVETSRNSYNDTITFKNLDRDFVSLALPIAAYFASNLEKTIYSIEVLETSEQYTSVVSYIGFGLNTDQTGNSMALNLYRMYLDLDKSSGSIDWRKNDAGDLRFTYKSYSISDAEYKNLISP